MTFERKGSLNTTFDYSYGGRHDVMLMLDLCIVCKMFVPSTFFTVKSGVHLLDGYYDDIVEFTRAPVTHSLTHSLIN